MGKSEKRQGQGEGKREREGNICREKERKEEDYIDRKWKSARKYREREKEKKRVKGIQRERESEEKYLCRCIMRKGEGKRERGKDMQSDERKRSVKREGIQRQYEIWRKRIYKNRREEKGTKQRQNKLTNREKRKL